MREITAAVMPNSLVTVTGDAGFAAEHNAALLRVALNAELGAADVSYHCFCFDVYGLGRKIVSNNIYGIAGDAPAYRSGNTLCCPLPEALTATGELTVQIEAHRVVDGEVDRIIKSGIFTLSFEPSVTGGEEELDACCGLLPRIQAALAGLESPDKGVAICTPAGYAAINPKNTARFYLVVDETQAEEDEPAAVAVTGVTIGQASASIISGGTQTLTAAVMPADAGNKSVSWSSSNTGVAGVSQTGAVTAAAPGSAVITVTTADGGFTATCTVTVSAQTIAVTGVALSKASTGISAGSTETLTATVTPAGASNKAVIWSSSNTGVAGVSQAGAVTAAAPGSAVITATTADGGFTAVCAVTVTAALPGLWQGTKTVNGITVTISGNRVTLNGTKNTADNTGGGGYLTDNLVSLFVVPPAWHTFAAGTQISIVTANKTGTAACNAANAAFMLRKTDNTILTGAAWGSPTGTFTYTCTGSTPVYGLLFYMQPGETVTNYGFDAEFWVNGVRWF